MSAFAIAPVIAGVLVGLSYGLLGVGLVLIYRSNRVINFAHAQIGVVGAAITALLVRSYSVPYWVSFVIGCVLAAMLAALSEVVVIRRLRNAPRIMSVVATLGLGQFLLFFALAVNPSAFSGGIYPVPPGLPSGHVGGFYVSGAFSGLLVLSPIVVAGLAVFLRRHVYGIGIRAAAVNPDAARMAGLSAARMSSLAWAIAGGISAFTAILVIPSQGVVSASGVGPGLMLRGLAAAVIARMTSLPIAMLAGLGVGVVQEEISLRSGQDSLVSVVLFAVILVALLLQRGARSGREDEKGSWAAVQAWRPVPAELRHLPVVRYAPWIAAVVAVGVLALVPFVGGDGFALAMEQLLCFAVIGTSIGIVTGMGGQLTLGQVALAGIGAVVSYRYSSHFGDFLISFLLAGLTTAVISVLIGLPALRVRGLLYAVTTLALAVATESWLLPRKWMLGEGLDPGKPVIFGHEFRFGRGYYPIVLVTCVLLVGLVARVRRSGFGRRLTAVRDNEDQARAFSVPTTLVKLQAFAVAGFVAGVAGAALGHSFAQLSQDGFPASDSIDVVTLSVLGGLGLLAGPLLGAFYTKGIPLLHVGNAGLAATTLGALLLIVYFPNGLAGMVAPLRDRALGVLARRHGIDLAAKDDADAAVPERPPALAEPRVPPPRSAAPEVLLSVRGLAKRYGGVHAVDGVSLDVYRGETLGLLGPNGAGKTTLFELIGGFARPDTGIIVLSGRDVTWLPPQYRVRLGLVRSFQDAGLFSTLTVLDTVKLSLERLEPSRLRHVIAGGGRIERERTAKARELVAAMGLDRFRDRTIAELSTGTRRITELACCLAMEPTLLLLDEPSSGIAQRETEALGGVIEALKARLDATLVVIEHDMPLLGGLADRLVAMESGRVIAVGEPGEVLADPRVVESYLGGDVVTIERSGVGA